MSNVLIDVSYLHSAYRCFKGKAKTKNDIVNLYRLLAEIIAHKNIFIKVNKDGPVYGKAIESIEFFKKISNDKFQIQQIDKKINYNTIIKGASASLKNTNISFLFKNSVTELDNSPEFSIEKHPDTSFHEWLVNEIETLPKRFSSLNDGTYIPIAIGQQLSFRDYFKKISKRDWNLSKSIALAAQIRTFAYIEMAKQLNIVYIPSATRAQNSSYTINSPTLRNILSTDVKTYQDFKKSFIENTDVISGVILRNRCMPINALQDTFDLREKTAHLRDWLYKKPWLKSGESLLLYKYSKLAELAKIRDEYLANGRLLFDIEDLSIGFTTSSPDPTIEILTPVFKSVFKVFDFARKKRILNDIKSLILPIAQMKSSKPNNELKKLQLNSGLSE